MSKKYLINKTLQIKLNKMINIYKLANIQYMYKIKYYCYSIFISSLYIYSFLIISCSNNNT